MSTTKKLINKLDNIMKKCEKMEIEAIYFSGKSNIEKKLETVEFCLNDIEEFEKTETPAKLKAATVLNI